MGRVALQREWKIGEGCRTESVEDWGRVPYRECGRLGIGALQRVWKIGEGCPTESVEDWGLVPYRECGRLGRGRVYPVISGDFFKFEVIKHF